MGAMKTVKDIDDAVNQLSDIARQRGLSEVQYGVLCGMITSLSWVLDRRDETQDVPNALARLLKNGFIHTTECN